MNINKQTQCRYCEKAITDELPINTNMSLQKTFAFIAPGVIQKEIVFHINDWVNKHIDDVNAQKFEGTYGIPINYCPMCGRKLTEDEI